ncbi:hypothetical protein ACLB2K_025321 [Fragaria x ananassa]
MAFPSILLALVSYFLLLGIVEVSEASSRALVNNNSINISQIFEKWMEKHGRAYSNSSEKEKRFAIFKAKYEQMEKFNSQAKESFTLGLNAFSDLTHEELHELYGNTLEIPNITRSSNSSFRYNSIKYEDLPQNWDWRTKGAVTKVKHQGTVCDCSKDYGTHGCAGGRSPNAIRYVAEYGLVSEEKYPYEAVDYNGCDTKLQETPDVTIYSYEFTPEFDEIALAKAVYHQPVTIMHATSKEFYRYGGGVYADSTGDCSRNNVSHTSLLVGYGTTSDGVNYWLLKNTWGESWGEQGYMRLLRSTRKKLGRGICNLAHLAMYPTL